VAKLSTQAFSILAFYVAFVAMQAVYCNHPGGLFSPPQSINDQHRSCDQLQASKIPAFYVAFVVTPYASNASELVSSLIFASRKHKKNISLTFSQVKLSSSFYQACSGGSG